VLVVSFTESDDATEYVPALREGVGAETDSAAIATEVLPVNSCTGALNTPADITAANRTLIIRFFMAVIPFK
jgi:hypothetical protein